MNCLAHAIRFFDEPWFVAGTGIPDWLSMCDRKVRLRPQHVEPSIQQADDSSMTLLARGIQQHWHDDDWFHRSAGFFEVSNAIGQMFKVAFDTGDNFRAGFLGHIATELLIDGQLAERHPDALDQYYDTVRSIDPHELQAFVNEFGAKETQNIVPFLNLYLQEEFLRDYVHDDRLLYRLNRVLNRVRLPGLPNDGAKVVGRARELVDSRLADLVSQEIIAGKPHF